MVKLGYTITYVADVEKALAFFENAFGIARRFRTPENSYGELETGETTLALASHMRVRPRLVARNSRHQRKIPGGKRSHIFVARQGS